MKNILVYLSASFVCTMLFSCGGNNAEKQDSLIQSDEDSASFMTGYWGEPSFCTVAENTVLMNDSLCLKPSEVTIAVGDSVQVQGITENRFMHDGWEQLVYKVSLKKGTTVHSGYLIQEQLALMPVKLADDRYCVVSVYIKNKHFRIKGLILDSNRKQIDEFNDDASGGVPEENDKMSYTHYINVALSGSKGLADISKTIEITEGYDACGYVNGVSYWTWNGTKAQKIIQAYSMSEAGLFANYYEIVFPGDKGGKDNKIIKRSMHIEYEDTVTSAFDSTVVEYRWDKDKGVVGSDTVFRYSKKA